MQRVSLDGADKEIQITIAIHVTERRPAAPVRQVQTHQCRHLPVGTIALVFIEVIGCGVTAHHIQIDVSVAIIVRSSDSTAEALRIRHLRQNTAAERSLVQSGITVAFERNRWWLGRRRTSVAGGGHGIGHFATSPTATTVYPAQQRNEQDCPQSMHDINYESLPRT